MKGIYIDDRYLVLNIQYEYLIELNRINTPTKAYQWIIHLLEKNWITREMLARMVAILEIHFQYNLHEFTNTAVRGNA